MILGLLGQFRGCRVIGGVKVVEWRMGSKSGLKAEVQLQQLPRVGKVGT